MRERSRAYPKLSDLRHEHPVQRSELSSMRAKLFYGFGSIAYGVKDFGFGTLLLFYYNQVIGLPAGEVELRHRPGSGVRRLCRSDCRTDFRQPAHGMGTAASADVRIRGSGRRVLLLPLDSAALVAPGPVLLSRRNGDHRAHLHHHVRDSEFRHGARDDGRLRPAHQLHLDPISLRRYRRRRA